MRMVKIERSTSQLSLLPDLFSELFAFSGWPHLTVRLAELGEHQTIQFTTRVMQSASAIPLGVRS
jgi:hypothetical protein